MAFVSTFEFNSLLIHLYIVYLQVYFCPPKCPLPQAFGQDCRQGQPDIVPSIHPSGLYTINGTLAAHPDQTKCQMGPEA